MINFKFAPRHESRVDLKVIDKFIYNNKEIYLKCSNDKSRSYYYYIDQECCIAHCEFGPAYIDSQGNEYFALCGYWYEKDVWFSKISNKDKVEYMFRGRE